MGLRMKFFLLATLLCSGAAFAQHAADAASPSPVGVWATPRPPPWYCGAVAGAPYELSVSTPVLAL